MKKQLLFLTALFSVYIFQAQDVWTTYNTTNSGLTFDAVSDIEFDSEGNKWVASWYNNGSNGIAKFDDTSWTIYSTQNIQASNDIHKIEYTTGAIEAWVSIYAEATVYLADDTQITVTSEHNYTNNILTLEIPKNATSIQVDYYIEDPSVSVEMNFYNEYTQEIVAQETFSGENDYQYTYASFNNIASDQIIDIAIDALDNKWLGSWQDGLLKFDDVSWTQYTTSNSDLPNDNINCVATDNNNDVWIGTASGLTKFNGTSFTTYTTANSNLPTNNVTTIAIDDTNTIWLTTANELVKFTGTDWTIFNDDNTGNWFGGANSLVIDENNVKWMSAGYGVKSFDGTNWQYFNYLADDNDSCLLDCQTTSLAIDINNEIWVGAHQECSQGGLLNLTQCETYLSTNSNLPENSILSLKIDKDGTKWIGTFDGLTKLEKSTLSVQNTLDATEISFYPNPSKDNIYIDVENNLIGSKYVIFDANGKKNKKGTLNANKNMIDIHDLADNLYFITIKNNDNARTIKFIR